MKLTDKLKPGMTVYSVGRQHMGHTTMTRAACWPVYIHEVDLEKRTVVASWNGNRERTYYASDVAKWRWTRPGTNPRRAPTPEPETDR